MTNIGCSSGYTADRIATCLIKDVEAQDKYSSCSGCTCTTLCTSVSAAGKATQECTRSCDIEHGTCSYSGSTQTCVSGNYTSSGCSSAGDTCSGCSGQWGECTGGTKSITCNEGYYKSGNACLCTTLCTSAANRETSSGTEGCSYDCTSSIANAASATYSGTRSYTNTCNGNYTAGGCKSAGASCSGCSSWTRTSTGSCGSGSCTLNSCKSGYYKDGNACYCTTSCTSVANSTSTTSGTEDCSYDCTSSIANAASATYSGTRSYTNTCNGNYTAGGCSSAGATCTGCSSWSRTSTGTCGSGSCTLNSCNSGYYKDGNACVCTTPCTSVANSTSTTSGTEDCSYDYTSYIANAASATYYGTRSYTNTCNGKYTGGGCSSAGASCTGCSSWTRTSTGTCEGGTISITCNAGYYLKDGECVQCDPGTYSSAGATSCKTCTGLPSNAEWTGSATSNACPWRCKANYYKSGSSCKPCSGVSFTDTGTDTETITGGSRTRSKTRTCYRTTSSAGSTSSSACSGSGNCGTWSYGAWDAVCSTGYTQNANDDGCNCNTNCTAVSNTSSTQTCTRSCDIDHGTCSYSGSTQTCNGKYTAGGCSSAGATCSGCSSWGACTGGTKSITCHAGYYLKDGECVQCDKGTYSSAGATSCKTCTGLPSNAEWTGSATSNACPWRCKADYYKSGSLCAACSDVSFTDTGTETQTITGGSRKRSKTRTCYRTTSSAGSTSSSACSGSGNCGTWSYGAWDATCSTGYTQNANDDGCNCNTNCTAVSNTSSTQDCTRSCDIDHGTCSYSGSTQTCNGNYTAGGCSSAGATCSGCSSWGACTGGTISITCNAGYYLKDGKCAQCEAGYYCPGDNSRGSCSGRTKYSGAGASKCSDVSGGHYTTGCNSSGNNCKDQSQCTDATYCSEGIQYDCPDGYTADTSNGKTLAKQCKISVSGGKYLTTKNKTTTASCLAGYYKAAHTVAYGDTSSCSVCTGRTKYSTGGASECSTVSSGYYTTKCNSSNNACTGQSECGSNAYYCSGGIRYSVTSGYYSTGGSATTRTGQKQCTAGTYCSGGVSASCPGGTYGSTAGLTTNACSGQCKEGYYCPAGSTSATQNACPSGSSSAAGADAVADCSCVAGYGGDASSGSACTICAAGYYKSSAGNTSCSNCGKGYYCTGGTARAACPAGTYGSTDNLKTAACTGPCAGGRYGSSTAQTASTCNGSCTEGYYCPEGSTSSTQNACSAGYYCPAGSASQSPCTGRTQYSAAKASACSTVSSGYYTTNCNSSGNYCTGQSQCTGATYCSGGIQYNCPSGYTADTLNGKTLATQCKISVSGGKYLTTKNKTTTASCLAGYYKAAHTVAYGSTSSCSVCETDKYSDEGAAACTACPTDYKNTGDTAKKHASSASCIITVTAGKYIGTAGDNTTNWDTCAAGTYKPQHTVAYGSTSSCPVCGTDKYSDVGAGTCTACPTDYKNTGDTAKKHASSASCIIT
ncbi:MAG: hypothetical protein IKJ62_00970, partial [Alphaproteobacteria bacterium]|nr:hypothetical protein [Alphaproteobacteria bacterium]